MGAENLSILIQELIDGGAFSDVMTNPLLQIGMPNKPFIFSQLLPEENVSKNSFRDTKIQYRSMIANDGTRYSPVMMKGGAKVGEALFELVDSDLGMQFDGEAYDSLLDQLNYSGNMDVAALTLLQFADMVAQGLAAKREKQRADALVFAKCIREGVNGLSEEIFYPNPAGNRITISGGTIASPQGLYNNTIDPMVQIVDFITKQQDEKGLYINRIVSTRKVMDGFRKNAKIANYGVSVVASAAGTLTQVPDRPGYQAVLNAFATHELPIPETYDLRYMDMAGSKRYIPNNVFMMFFETDQARTRNLDIEETTQVEFLYNTLGYTAIGRPAGQLTSGIANTVVLNTEDKPSIAVKGWQTTLPIIQIPEAIGVFTYTEPV